jgi:ABC-2 type transport system permease protein
MAVRNISMLFSASDFYSYTNFQSAAEAYRYRLAQEMNVLQMKYISNKKQGANDKPYSISRSHWQSFPDFKYRHLAAAAVFENAVVPLLALAVWGLLSFLMIVFTAKKAKAI